MIDGGEMREEGKRREIQRLTMRRTALNITWKKEVMCLTVLHYEIIIHVISHRPFSAFNNHKLFSKDFFM